MKHLPFLLTATTVALSTFAKADIVSTTNLSPLSPPANLTLNQTQSDTESRFMVEKLSFTLPTSLLVDIATPGTYLDTTRWTPQTLAAGTVVNVYLIHADTVALNTVKYTSSITFDEDILGLIVSRIGLDETDGLFGLPGVTFHTGHPTRGVTFEGGVSDTVVLTQHSVTTTLANGQRVDQLRIITASTPVPEPGTVGLLGAALCGLLAGRRRR